MAACLTTSNSRVWHASVPSFAEVRLGRFFSNDLSASPHFLQFMDDATIKVKNTKSAGEMLAPADLPLQ